MTPVRAGPFDDPLKGWPNSDLLIAPESRRLLQSSHPEVFRVLDWPELRAAFEEHDRAANDSKRWSRVQGLSGLSISGLGVMALAVSPLVADDKRDFVAIAALILMSVGGIVGILHWTVLHSKQVWLGHRFWTERLRQLHFQSIVHNLDLVASAMTSDEDLEELKRRRTRWLADVHAAPSDPRHLIRRVTADRTDRHLWLQPEFAPIKSPAAPPARLTELLDVLARLRIGIQLEYAQRNLGSDIHSAPFRAKALRALADLFVVTGVSATVAAWISLVFGSVVLRFTTVEWICLAALAGAGGLTCKSMLEGLQAEADTDRYETYADSLGEAKARFEQGGAKAKVAALRQVELLAYREMRHFLRTHQTARFLG